jgi:hypothetical protein
MAEQLPILEQRRIEAQVIKPIYEEMAAQLGAEKAQSILDTAIRNAAKEQAASFAAKTEGGPTLTSFIELFDLWKAAGALEVEVLHEAEDRFDFNIVRCRYAEMYKEMGLGEIGHLLSCNRDGSFCEGYNPDIKLERGQTIMSGASHCDFRYTVEK